MATGHKPPRRHTPEFRAAAVQRLRDELVRGRSMSEVARALGLTTGLLSRWRSEADRRASEATGADESLEAEVRRLRREVETLRQERDFAKKAAAYFARELP